MEIVEEWDGEGSCYAIGWRGELVAGIRPGEVTPYFKSLKELAAYCRLNMDRIKAYTAEAVASDNWDVPDGYIEEWYNN
mgnify:FL=1